MLPTWRTIPFNRLYEVSDQGGIRRSAGGKGAQRGHELALQIDDKGYSYVMLHDGHGKTKKCCAHKAVSRAFLGPCPTGHEPDHISGDKSDNSVENLEYVTHKVNVHRAIKLGTFKFKRGKQIGTAKLTGETVLKIFKLRGSASQRAIAERFHVSRETVNLIHNGYNWAWLTGARRVTRQLCRIGSE